MSGTRRNKLGHRRRVEDEGDDDIRDDDSSSDGSLSDDNGGQDSDASNMDDAPSTPRNALKTVNGTVANGPGSQSLKTGGALGTVNGGLRHVSDTAMMMHGLTIEDIPATTKELHIDQTGISPPRSPSAPVIVSSDSAMRQQQDDPHVDRRRQEHEDYKRRRDEDPSFVPNRGSFFMHDHRHSGPGGNGFRPFGRGRGRGNRHGIGGPFAPFSHVPFSGDPTTTFPWAHDMHEVVAEPDSRPSRRLPDTEGPPNGTGHIPTCPPSSTPINRTLSTEKHIGNLQVRVSLPTMRTARVFSGMPVKQYIKLPDHRPPLRRDRPVRISLPYHSPRYVYPASDRSFTFIPRSLRPNQQRMRGQPRSTWGSAGGFSRRTSVFGGSFYGSVYSPSVALSRRSSIVHDRDFIYSPAESVVSRPSMLADNHRPVVRLPPSGAPPPSLMPMQLPGPVLGPMYGSVPPPGPMTVPVAMRSMAAAGPVLTSQPEQPAVADDPSINGLRQPQTQPHAHNTTVVQENRPNSIPMHQPRPQKNISVADIETPTMVQSGASASGVPPAFQQAFHQQVPPQVTNGYGQESHSRRPSHQQSTGTPLSHIPERAIHAAPFQPNAYGQPPPFYGEQLYHIPPQQGFYYAPGYPGPAMAPPAAAPAYVPNGQPGAVPGTFATQSQPDEPAGPHGHGHSPSTGSNLVAQEVNGMVYYYDASQMASVNSFPPYAAPQGYHQAGVMGGGNMVTPSPDGFYYTQHTPGMVFYPQ